MEEQWGGLHPHMQLHAVLGAFYPTGSPSTLADAAEDMCKPAQAFAPADLSARMSSLHSVHPQGPSYIILTPEKRTVQGVRESLLLRDGGCWRRSESPLTWKLGSISCLGAVLSPPLRDHTWESGCDTLGQPGAVRALYLRPHGSPRSLPLP